MSVLTKEKIEAFRHYMYVSQDVRPERADKTLLTVIQMLNIDCLLADWELKDILRDISNGRDIENSYSWVRGEAAFLLQCPLVYEYYVDLQSNKAALRDAAKQRIEYMEAVEANKAAIASAPTDNELTGED